MGLKKMPGLAGGPDIKQEPSHPKPAARLWRESLPQCSPYSRGRTGTGEMGTCWPHLQHQASSTLVPCRLGVGGVFDPFSSPLRSGNGQMDGEAWRQYPWGLNPDASSLKPGGRGLTRPKKETSSLHSPCIMER